MAKSVDVRTDLWAFGCVLYEMITGRRAFPGESVTDTLSAVISKEPAWEALPATTPAGVRRLLRRCLTKDRKQRLASASDARLEIEDALSLTGSTATESPPHAPRRSALVFSSLGLGVGLLAAVGAYMFGTSASRAAAPPPTVTRLVLQAPTGTQIVSGHREIAVSADGRQVAFIAQGAADQHIYVRRLDELESHQVAGTKGARDLAFSPDGRWLVFHAGNKIRKVSLSGGSPTVLAEAVHSHGLAWHPTEDAIYFGSEVGAIWKVSAGGGPSVAVTQLDKAHGEHSHEWPVFSIDGRTLLFSVNTNIADLDDEKISLLDLGTSVRQTVRTGGSAVGFTDTRELLFVREHSLMSAPYDSTRHVIASGDRELVAGVMRGGGGSTVSLSSSGTLAYVPSPDLNRRSLVWIAPDGTQTDANFGRRQFRAVNISLDGRRVAVAATDHDGTAWDVGDTSGGTLTPVATSQGRSAEMPWNPDGKSFAVADSHNARGLVRFSVLEGGIGESLLPDGAANLPEQWTADGRGLIFTRHETESGRRSICLLSLASSPAKWSVIVDGGQNAVRMASLSPDGHWLAYESNESGRFEIYVQAYPVSAGKIRVSVDGGTKARWTKNSDRLYFIDRTTFMVSTVTTHPELRSDVPRPVFNEPLLAQDSGIRLYDVGPDGRILAIKEDDSVRSDHIIVVQNWLSEVRALLSAPRR